MRKAIIIDDRPIRQSRYLDETAKRELENIDSVEFCNELNANPEYYKEYNFVAIHRSLLIDKNIRQEFIDFCKAQDKYLVTFSGGTSEEVFYSDHFIEMNASTFYNKGRLHCFLKDFCEDNTQEIHILKLVYGENWKLPYLIEYEHLLWQHRGQTENVWERLETLKDIIGPNLSDDEKLRQNEIKLLKNKM